MEPKEQQRATTLFLLQAPVLPFTSPKGLGVTCCDKKAVKTWKSGEEVQV